MDQKGFVPNITDKLANLGFGKASTTQCKGFKMSCGWLTETLDLAFSISNFTSRYFRDFKKYARKEGSRILLV